MVLRSARGLYSSVVADYGMILVLLALCGYYCVATYSEQYPSGAAAGEEIVDRLSGRELSSVAVIVRRNDEELAFAKALEQGLQNSGVAVEVVSGDPAEARRALERMGGGGAPRPDVLVCTRTTSSWSFVESVGSEFPALSGTEVMTPESYWWPDFLKTENLLNIANQIAVIAIIAIGMTMVIITAGIDLSVGSLIALSAVLATLLIREFAGARDATALTMTLSCLAAIGVCSLVGIFTGIMVTRFEIPPFIVTLAMMLVARGLAYQFAGGKSVYQLPDSFVWLGRGADLLGLPNAVVLMVLLYVIAHVVMTRTALGRYIYAIGGNLEAARLSGVPYRRVLLFVYALSAALAGLGGVVMASQLKSGSPTYGLMYELFVIAAVVVGGTSLQGGEGKILGTLIGAFIIAVIRNGMNLTGVESYTQDIVLGFVILAAVVADKLKRRGGWKWISRMLRLVFRVSSS